MTEFHGVVVEHEAAVVRQMFTRFHAGDSLRGIVAWLAAQGVPMRSPELRVAAQNVLVALPGKLNIDVNLDTGSTWRDTPGCGWRRPIMSGNC